MPTSGARRLLTLELLQLILRLRVLRVELNGGLEILDRGPLVALRVLRLRHRLIRLRRLGEVFEVRLQILERIIRPLRVERGGRDADERVFGEVVLLAAVELRAELLELREARARATTLLGLADRLAERGWNRQAVVA